MKQNALIAGWGEIMLRLAPPDHQRLLQSLPGTLTATFAGSEANACADIALWGGRTRFLTILPDNAVSRSALCQLRGVGVDVDHVGWVSNGRIGLFYVEHGAAQRSTSVIYDREHSAISEADASAYDFDAMFAGADHLHVTGITPAISEKAYRATLAGITKAKAMGLTLSCDLNYRGKLWKWRSGTPQRELAAECMAPIAEACDVLIGSEDDVSKIFNIPEGDPAAMAKELSRRFPKAEYVGIPLQFNRSADWAGWGGVLYDRKTDKVHFAPADAQGKLKALEIRDIVDRFGGGDAFSAALLHALSTPKYAAPETAVRFATAASCLKYSVNSDYDYVTPAEIEALMASDGSDGVSR